MRKFITLFRLIIFIAFVFIGDKNYGQKDLSEIIKTTTNNDKDKYIALYKDLHQHPELSFDVKRTADIAAAELESYGYSVIKHIAQNGFAAILRNGEGATVWYRADMDALPVKETTGIPWESTKKVQLEDGSETYVGHMCGHDAHVTWMLEVAKFLSEHKKTWKGTIVFIGQPAEEMGDGAKHMVQDGLYDKYDIPFPDYLFGMHTAPYSVGTVVAPAGYFYAGLDFMDIIFHGIGGHGSAPDKTIDPTLMAANAVIQYESIISHRVDTRDPAILTVGSLKSGETNNVIPNNATLKLNMRWFESEVRDKIKESIRDINEGIARSWNLPTDKYPTEIDKDWSYPLINDTTLTKIVRSSLKNTVNVERIVSEKGFQPEMGSEDFQHLVLDTPANDIPFSYINIGIADEKAYEKSMREKGVPPYQPHNGDYKVELDAIPFGGEVGITSVLGIFNWANNK